MAAVNVPDSSDNSLTLPPPEGNTTGKGAQRKTCQGGNAKIFLLCLQIRRPRTKYFTTRQANWPRIASHKTRSQSGTTGLEGQKSSISKTTPNPHHRQPSTAHRRTRRKPERDCTTADAKSIIPLLRAFCVYTQILNPWPPRAISYNFS